MPDLAHDPEFEERLRQTIREEIEAEREQREGVFWWIATAVVFGPAVLVGVVAVGIVHLVAAARRWRSDTA